MTHRVSDMNSSGKIEYGIDTNDGSRSRKMRMTRLVGPIESGKDVNSRLKDLGSACARRRYVKTVSMLLVLCAAAIVVVSALALTEASQTTISAKARQPGSPHTVYGYEFDADGVTPLNGCVVTITNTATGEFIIFNETHDGWDPSINIYSVDLSELLVHGWTVGDILNVTAVKGAATGWNESAITAAAFDRIDVTLNGTAIPEFPMVILPVGGMIALFAVVSLRRKGKEQ
jgi:hypothetical protein